MRSNPTRLLVNLFAASLLLTACGGLSNSEQALVQIGLDSSDELQEVTDVETLAGELCSSGEEEESVVFATSVDVEIAQVFCPSVAAAAVVREDAYLAELEDANVADEFAADRAALAAAERTCEELDQGASPQGSEAQRIAVDWFCPDYADSFSVLDVIAVSGTFELFDEDETFRSSCSGEGGYGDINSSTAVILRDREGSELSRAELGFGDGNGKTCEFSFRLQGITEGSPGDVYVLEVGDRGEISYSFAELRVPGAVALTIGR